MPQDCRGLTLGHVELVLARAVQPVQRVRLCLISGRVQQAPGRLESDLLP